MNFGQIQKKTVWATIICIIVMLLIAVLGLWFMLRSDLTIDAQEIDSILLSDSAGHFLEISNPSAIEEIAQIISGSTRCLFSPHETRQVLMLSIGSQNYPIVRDPQNRLYLDEGGHYLSLNTNRFLEFMNSDEASGFYASEMPSTISVGASSTLVLTADAYDWKIVKLDGSAHSLVLENDSQATLPRFVLEDTAELSLYIPRDPDELKITLYDGADILWQGSGREWFSYEPEHNGIYTCQIDAIYRETTVSNVSSYGTVTYRCEVDYQLKTEITLSKDTAVLGEVLTLTASGVGDLPISVSSNLRVDPIFVGTGGRRTAMVPISYYTVPGDSFYIDVTCGDYHQRFSLTVEDYEFEVQYLTVDEDLASSTIGSSTASAEYSQAIDPVRYVMDETQYWTEPFIQPVEGEISTEFGMMRYTNDNPTPTRHEGIDIATDAGTPVLAANAGRVIYAGYLQMTGNTVLIEHGFGLKSWYYHMESLSVQTDDIVTRGQEIGKVGSTGFSTGPHLHFNFSVNNTYLNPWLIFGKTLTDS